MEHADDRRGVFFLIAAPAELGWGIHLWHLGILGVHHFQIFPTSLAFSIQFSIPELFSSRSEIQAVSNQIPTTSTTSGGAVSVVVYNGALTACDKGHQWQIALEILSTLTKRKELSGPNMTKNEELFSAESF